MGLSFIFDNHSFSGTGFFKFKEGGYTRYTGDKDMDKYIDKCSQDLTKWEKITEVAQCL